MQKILVIDDDRDMCLLLKRFLTKHGFDVLEANTAKKATELLETTEFDLVLCDFRLDNTDGKTMLIRNSVETSFQIRMCCDVYLTTPFFN